MRPWSPRRKILNIAPGNRRSKRKCNFPTIHVGGTCYVGGASSLVLCDTWFASFIRLISHWYPSFHSRTFLPHRTLPGPLPQPVRRSVVRGFGGFDDGNLILLRTRHLAARLLWGWLCLRLSLLRRLCSLLLLLLAGVAAFLLPAAATPQGHHVLQTDGGRLEQCAVSTGKGAAWAKMVWPDYTVTVIYFMTILRSYEFTWWLFIIYGDSYVFILFPLDFFSPVELQPFEPYCRGARIRPDHCNKVVFSPKTTMEKMIVTSRCLSLWLLGRKKMSGLEVYKTVAARSWQWQDLHWA